VAKAGLLRLSATNRKGRLFEARGPSNCQSSLEGQSLGWPAEAEISARCAGADAPEFSEEIDMLQRSSVAVRPLLLVGCQSS